MTQYRDRSSAGKFLAGRLETLRIDKPVVLGLPRGGVPVAAEVAAALNAPPRHRGGAQSSAVRTTRNWRWALSVRAACGSSTTTSSQRFASRKENSSPSNATSEPNWNGGRISCARGGPRFPSTERTAVIVDDGMATGASAAVACRCARTAGAAAVIVAVPVASPEAMRVIACSADRVVCPFVPALLGGVGACIRGLSSTQRRRSAVLPRLSAHLSSLSTVQEISENL